MQLEVEDGASRSLTRAKELHRSRFDHFFVSVHQQDRPRVELPELMAVCVSIDRFLCQDAAPICYLPFDGRHPGVGASASFSISKTAPVESYVALPNRWANSIQFFVKKVQSWSLTNVKRVGWCYRYRGGRFVDAPLLERSLRFNSRQTGVSSIPDA